MKLLKTHFVSLVVICLFIVCFVIFLYEVIFDTKQTTTVDAQIEDGQFKVSSWYRIRHKVGGNENIAVIDDIEYGIQYIVVIGDDGDVAITPRLKNTEIIEE